MRESTGDCKDHQRLEIHLEGLLETFRKYSDVDC